MRAAIKPRQVVEAKPKRCGRRELGVAAPDPAHREQEEGYGKHRKTAAYMPADRRDG